MTGSIITNNGRNLLIKRLTRTSDTIISKFAIGTGTSDPNVTDTSLETMITAWYGGANYKGYMTGYPTYNTTDHKYTTRCKLLSTEANGNTISEIGEFNTDSTPVMFSHYVFTGISKSSSVEIIFEITNQIT